MRRRDGSSDDDDIASAATVTPVPTNPRRDANADTLMPADAIGKAATMTPLPIRTNTAADALGETLMPADAFGSSETMTPAEALASGETVTPSEAFARALDAHARSPSSVDRRPTPGVLPEIARATYAVRRELARGGMGRILVADDSRLGRRVALKELIAKDRGLQRRFAREVRITARLQHPGIVPVYEAGHWPDGEPFYAMKLVAGTSLEKVVENKPELEDRLRLVPNLVQLAEAMAYAHGSGVIHRDLKPANVLVGDFGETVVIDWGLAKEISDRDDDDHEDDSISPASTGMTMTGAVVGTPAYMPPEQARGELVGARADVYSLGALMWHVLAGRPPYQGSIESVLEQVRTRPPPPLSSVEPGIPAELATIVEHAMERDPDLRYPTARELAEELSRFQTGQLVTRHDYTTWQLFTRWVKRHRAAVMSGAALLVGASVVGVIAMRQVLAERDRARAISLAALEEQGRRELIEGHPFRASVYFSAAYRGGRQGESLRLMFGEAMRAVDANIATWTTGAWITHLAWTSKDELVAVADDGAVTLWDVTTNKRAVVAGDPVRPIGAAMSDDGGRLAVVGETSLRIIDLRSRTATVVKLARFSPRDVVVMADGTVAVQGVADTGGASVRLFGPDGSERPLTATSPWSIFPAPHTYVARGAVVTEPAGEDDSRPSVSEYQVVNAADIKRPLGRRDHAMSYATAAIDRAGTHFAAGTGDGSVQVWDVVTGLPLASFDGHTRPVNALAFEPTGSRLASAGDDGVVRVWDLSGPAFALPAPSTTVGELASASSDGHVRATARRNEVLVGDRVFRGLEELVSWVDTSADGAMVVAGARDGHVATWETSTGHKINDWELPSAITAGDVSRDGSIAVGTREGTARIFRESGVDPVRLEGHASAIHALAWHPTRAELLSAADTAVRVWSPQGSLLRYLAAGEPIARAWWAGDGRWIVVDAQTSLQIWDGTQGKLLLRVPHGLAPQAVPPISEPVFGARGEGTAVARLGVTGFVAYPLARETRPASKLAAAIADHVPWRLAGSELVPASAALSVRSDDTKQRKSAIFDFEGDTIGLAQSRPALPLTLANSTIANTYRALRSADRDGASKELARITDTKDPRTAYEAAWAAHFVGDEQVAYTLALRAWSSWPEAATKSSVLADLLRLAAWGELAQDTVVADLGNVADNKTRVALAKAYDDLGRYKLVTPTLEKLKINDDWQTRLLSLYLMASRAYTRGDFTIAAEELEIAARAVPAGKLPVVTLGADCSDVPMIPALDLTADPAASLAGLTHRLAADSFRTFSRVYDHRYALAARRLYALLGDRFGVPASRVESCTNELDLIAAGSYAKPGKLDKPMFRGALANQLTQLTTCYQREIDSDASVTGRVALRIEIGTNAKITNVDAFAEPETPALKSLAECVRNAVLRVELPRQSFTSRAIVYYPLTFGPPKATPDAGSTAGPRAP